MQMHTLLGSTAGSAVLALLLACSSDKADPAATGGSAATTGGAATTTGGATATTGGVSAGGAATGGSSSAGAAGATAGSGSGRPAELPKSDSVADIAAFIEAGGYKGSTWISETSMPRAGTPGTQHGGPVRVWENAPLVDSLKAGRDGRMSHPFPDQWSMAVKELYDEASGALVGAAVSFRTGAGTGADGAAWTYYCYGPDSRCTPAGGTTKETPIYGKGSISPTSTCGFCHGFSVYTLPP